jgi:hypothetical protein
LRSSRCEKLGHCPTPRADLADQIIGLDRQARDNAPLEPPVAEEMLAKFGTSGLRHGKGLYLSVSSRG